MSRKGPVAVEGMLDSVEDLIQDVNPHQAISSSEERFPNERKNRNFR